MAQAGFTPIITYHSTTGAAVPLAADLAAGEMALNIADMKLYCENSSGVVTLLASAAGSSGDVVGPASATDNAVARFDQTTGKLIQNSAVTIADTTGDIAGAGSITSTSASGILNRAAATQDGVIIAGRAGGTSSYAVTLTPTTLSANRTLTLPDASGTILQSGTAVTVAQGGTGQTSYTDGELLIGKTDGSLAKATLTQGSNITITNGNGTITIASTGGGGGGGTSVTVTQITATASQTTFNVTYTVGQLSVYLNGALLASADFTATNGTTVVLATGAAANDIFTAVAYSTVAGLTLQSASPFGTLVGSGAGAVNTGVNNVFVGFEAGNDNTTGTDNVAVGYQALDVNTTGVGNVAVGSGALGANTSGGNNTALGR